MNQKSPAASAPSLAASPPPAPAPGGVTMQDVLLDHASEIEEIEGQVKMDNVILDQKSRIGKIKGG